MKDFIRQSIIRPLWMIWEMGFGLLSRLRSVYASDFGICKVMVRKHRGESILCQDGTHVQDGDWIGELHLDNGKVLNLLKTRGSDRAALRVARMASDSMKQIARSTEERPEMSQIKALVGITLLHRGITHGLGFEQHKVKSGIFERLTTSYLRLLLSVMHPEGSKRIDRRKEKLVPIMLVHSRDSLRKRFLPPHERNDSVVSGMTDSFEIAPVAKAVPLEKEIIHAHY